MWKLRTEMKFWFSCCHPAVEVLASAAQMLPRACEHAVRNIIAQVYENIA